MDIKETRQNICHQCISSIHVSYIAVGKLLSLRGAALAGLLSCAHKKTLIIRKQQLKSIWGALEALSWHVTVRDAVCSPDTEKCDRSHCGLRCIRTVLE